MTTQLTTPDWATYLKAHGEEISAKAKAGDRLAQAVISTYTIYFRRPNHAARVVLECAVEDYRKAQVQA